MIPQLRRNCSNNLNLFWGGFLEKGLDFIVRLHDLREGIRAETDDTADLPRKDHFYSIADGTSDILKRGRRWRGFDPEETEKRDEASLFAFFGMDTG